ncbi:MAG: diguanylate cyclase [Bryobacteraceae bacterium]|nr:diguanylate cyclase [Bryobacteraceae bacterium]
MISIRHEQNQIERQQELQRSTLECCRALVKIAGETAVEVEKGGPAGLRKQTQSVASLLRDPEVEQLELAREQFQFHLRRYQRSAEAAVARLRGDLGAAVEALLAASDHLTHHSGETADRLGSELKNLRELATRDTVEELRQGIHASAASIASCVDEIRHKSRMEVAAMRDEIRVLQVRLDTLQREALSDSASGSASRSAIERSLLETARGPAPLSLALVAIRNWKRLEARYGQYRRDEQLARFVEAMRAVFGRTALLGRWTDDEFLVLLPTVHANPAALQHELTHRIEASRHSDPISFEIAMAFLDQIAGETPDQVLIRVGSLQRSLATSG